MKEIDIRHLEKMAKKFDPSEPLGDSFLDERYNWQKNDNGAEWPYYRFFYYLTRNLRPSLTVELGGYQGTAAAHLAAGWIQGNVITIDHHTDSGDEQNEVKMKLATARYPNLRYIKGWTTQELADSQIGHHALGNAPSAYPDVVATNQKIDILFVDSWHVYEHAIGDWNAYSPLLNSPALVICDDIMAGEVAGAPISGMLRFWEELPGEKFLNGNLHPGCNMGFVMVG